MAAPPLRNSSEGGSNGTTITTANSGAASGNPWDLVTISAGATCQFSNTQARDSLSIQLVTPNPFLEVRVDWQTLGSITADVFCRQYLYLASNPSAVINIALPRTNAGAGSAGICIDTSGFVFAKIAAGGTATGSQGAVAIATNQWIRVEWRVRSSTTVGEIEWWLYNTADSLTPSETKVSTGQVLGANTDQIRFGFPSAGPISTTMYMDDIAVALGKLGPSVVPASPQARPVLPTLHRFAALNTPTWPVMLPNPSVAAAGGTTFPQALTATASSTATFQIQVNKNVTATSSATASIVKLVTKTLTANATATATLTALKVILKALTATATATASIRVQVNKNLTATATSTAAIVKTVLKNLTATATATATLQALKVIVKVMTATATATATMTRKVNKTIAATASATATVTKTVTKTLVAAGSAIASIITAFIPAGGAIGFLGMFRSDQAGRGGEIDQNADFDSGQGGASQGPSDEGGFSSSQGGRMGSS